MVMMLRKVRNEVVNTSQITEGVENAVPLHVHIPRIGGRGSDLPFSFPYWRMNTGSLLKIDCIGQ
jgi:hypothetical protein